MAPSELVWVQYGSLDNPTTYLVGEIWPLIAETFTPNSAFNIVSINNSSPNGQDGPDNDEEIFE